MMKKLKRYKQLKNISDATLLEEASHLRLIFKGIIAVSFIVVLLVVWASLTEIKETSVAYGELVPKGHVQKVQHLEGGIISKVFVHNGEEVKVGDLLIAFNTASALTELNQLRSREVSLTLNSERLSAFVKGTSANLSQWGNKVIRSKYNPVKYKTQINKLLQDQKSLLESQYKTVRDQEGSLRNMIAQREEKLKELHQQRKVMSEHIKLLREEFNMYKQLRKNKFVSHKDYLTLLRAVNKAEGDRARNKSEIEQTEELLSEANNKLNELFSTSKENALKELAQINSELLEVRHKIDKVDERISRSKVKATIAGTIKGLKHYAGNVVQPGSFLLDIVPINNILLAEGKIEPRDIGHIKVGDAVTVKIMTYDFSRYGSIDGKLTKISASTFVDQKERPYYKATIELKKQFIGTKKKRKKLKPGMTVEANIITGEKSLLQYLLKPIHRSTSDAFHER